MRLAQTFRQKRNALVTAGFGQNMLLTVVNTFLLVYLIEYAGISLQGMAVVTAIMTAGKVFDAVNDPLMGGLIDITHTRWGKMRPYILFSALPVALCSTALFALPDWPEVWRLVFFGVAYVLWDVAYTLCDVPFWGLIGSAFEEKGERTRVISLVRAFGGIALGLATLGMPWLARFFSFAPQATASGWSLAAAIIFFLGMALYLLAFRVPEKSGTSSSREVSFAQLFRLLFKNRPLLLVLLGSTLGFGRQMIQVGGAVFAVIAYRDEAMFTLIGGAIIAGVVLSSFLAPLLFKWWDGRRLMIVSSFISAALYLAMYLAGYENTALFMLLIFLTGLMLGFFGVLQTTMIADAVDDIERKSGVRNDGISFSTLTFVSKIMGAIAILTFGFFVVYARYEKGVTVTPRMQHIVFSAITLLPAASCLVSAIPFFFYRLSSHPARLSD